MNLVFRLGIVLLTFFFLFSCSFGHQSPRYVKLAHNITDETAVMLLKEKKLYLIGTGGRMMHDIQMMEMCFNYYQEVDLKTARELLLYAVNEYLSNINNNAEVRPYLHDSPFTAKNIEIVIFVYKPDGTRTDTDKIDCISIDHGTIRYVNQQRRYSFQEETYEEGMKKLHEK